jgi:predicted Zn finger-like uncharacterized protein
MKIVCDACSAKYSISDDKVQGKVFKIRCKKCSNIIVVRGIAGAAPVEPTQLEKDTRVFDYGYDENSGADAIWHVVIDQDQVGPLTAVEVQKRFLDGEIDAETYIWREGFADWLPVNQVDVFAGLFAGSGAAPGDDSGSLFGHSSGEHRGGAVAVQDLFTGGASAGASMAPGDDDGDVFGARRPAPAAEAVQSKLRGERGENSVLFSLSNLAQLASDGPRPQASSSSSASSASGSAQHGGGEGSGLIDIRSMASAYLGPDRGSIKSASPMLGSSGDLPVFTNSGFGEAAVIVPMVRSSAGNNKVLYGLVALVGLLAVIAVVMVVILLKDKKTPTGNQVAMNPSVAADKLPATEPAATAPATDPATPVGSTPGSATNPATAPGNATADPGTSGSNGSVQPTEPKKPDKPAIRDPKKPREKPTPTSSKPTAPDERPAKVEKPDRSSDCDAVACLVDPSQACCKKTGGSKPSSGSTTTTKVDSSLPEQLDSSMIKAGIDRVKGRAQACGSKSSAKGSVKVKIKATPEGRVGSVDVISSPDDALGSCVASALRGASFAKTQRGMGFAYTLSF